MLIKQDNTRPITDLIVIDHDLAFYTDKKISVWQRLDKGLDGSACVSLSKFEKYYKPGCTLLAGRDYLTIMGGGVYKLPIIAEDIKVSRPDYTVDYLSLPQNKAYSRHKGISCEGANAILVTNGLAISTNGNIICATKTELPDGLYDTELMEVLSSLGDVDFHDFNNGNILLKADTQIVTIKQEVEYFPVEEAKSLLTKEYTYATMITAKELKTKIKGFEGTLTIAPNKIYSDDVFEILGGAGDIEVTLDLRTLKKATTKLTGSVTISFRDNSIKLEDYKGFYIIGGI